MTGPFELVGDDAPVCIDGVCELPGESTDEVQATDEVQVTDL